jgi:threonine/homoserine/homoserine lactone efflux protein
MWRFVLYCVGVSLSGVMSPGAMTASAIAAGVRRPWAGLMMALSAGNPFFVAWWATTGLLLTSQVARAYGAVAFALFAVIHWLCDLVWLLALSWASHFGAGFAGPRWQRAIQALCAAAMLLFGCWFLYKTGVLWLST